MNGLERYPEWSALGAAGDSLEALLRILGHAGGVSPDAGPETVSAPAWGDTRGRRPEPGEEMAEMSDPSETTAIAQMRAHVQAVLQGAPPLQLQQSIIAFYRAIATALGKLRDLNLPPDRAELGMVAAIVATYEQALDYLEAMDDAIEVEDTGALISAFRQAEAAVREVDRLLQKDREALAAS